MKTTKLTDRFLVNSVFPESIAARLRRGELPIADSYGDASVLFIDLVGSTSLTRHLSPGHWIAILKDYFDLLDNLVGQFEVYKVKTIGDAYMAVAGIDNGDDGAERIADFSLTAFKAIADYATEHEFPLQVRAGISTGHVIGGVIGGQRLAWDLWGDTVNMASRMESTSEPGKIQISETTYWRLYRTHQLEPRGIIDVKGEGNVGTWFLLDKK